jgi:hypothetical protein
VGALTVLSPTPFVPSRPNSIHGGFNHNRVTPSKAFDVACSDILGEEPS